MHGNRKLRQSARKQRDVRQISCGGEEDNVVRLEPPAPLDKSAQIIWRQLAGAFTTGTSNWHGQDTGPAYAKLPEGLQDVVIDFDVADQDGSARLDIARANGATDVTVNETARDQQHNAHTEELKEKGATRIPIR